MEPDKLAFHLNELFIALLAYAIENDEPFNADPIIMKQISEAMVEANQIPQLAIDYDEVSHRVKYGVILVPNEEKE